MFEAQLLLAKPSQPGDSVVVFSPWFPRQGDNIRGTLDVVEMGGSPTIEVRVFTKKAEDAGDGLDADASLMISMTGTTGRQTVEWPGVLKNLVRYRYEVTPEGDDEWVLFRMLSPVWFDSVRP